MTRPAGVVFDMDGLLLDSERLARDLFYASCKELGCDVELALYHRCVGASWEATRRILTDALGSRTYALLEASWTERYREATHAQPVPLKPGARAVLARLHALGIPRALATSTRRDVAETKLRLSGLLPHFSLLVCGGETERGKPHPDPYLAAVAGLTLAPEACWACEDSDNGVRAAHAAGLTVYQVPDLVPPGAEVVAFGHTVIDSLEELLTTLE